MTKRPTSKRGWHVDKRRASGVFAAAGTSGWGRDGLDVVKSGGGKKQPGGTTLVPSLEADAFGDTEALTRAIEAEKERRGSSMSYVVKAVRAAATDERPEPKTAFTRALRAMEDDLDSEVLLPGDGGNPSYITGDPHTFVWFIGNYVATWEQGNDMPATFYRYNPQELAHAIRSGDRYGNECDIFVYKSYDDADSQALIEMYGDHCVNLTIPQLASLLIFLDRDPWIEEVDTLSAQRAFDLAGFMPDIICHRCGATVT